VLGAVGAVNSEIAGLLQSQSWRSLSDIDIALIKLDGTPDKVRLGANAIVGASIACARALASADGRPLWQWLTPLGVQPRQQPATWP